MNNMKKQGDMQFLKRNSLMGDDLLNFDPSHLEEDDWNVFDDDAPVDTVLPGSPGSAAMTGSSSAGETPKQSTTTDTSSSNAESSTNPLKNSDSSSSAPAGSSSGDQESTESKEKQESQVKKGDGVGHSWQSESADLPHRKAMVQEIAQLLFARKKDNPGKKWLERLPLKARMLETQLYRNSSSLEAYLDRTTLKARLGKLASAITSHFKDAVSVRKQGSRGSTNSIRSVPDSFGSTSGSLSDNRRNRRSSTGELPSGPGITSLRREQSESAVGRQSVLIPGPPSTKLRREQSEPVVRSSNAQNAAMNLPNKGTGPRNPNNNNNSNSSNSIPPYGGNNVQTMLQQGANNGQMPQHQQQQFFSNMRQQQQNLVNQMNPQGAANNGQFMATQAAMMGGPNGVAMINQIQQQNAMNNMNLFQQQNRPGGMGGMQNMMAFQQQQLQQQNMGGAMFMSGNMPNNNMNMMHFASLPNVIPGATSNNNCNFQQQVNNSSMMTRDNVTMPPPTNANTSGRKAGGNDESSSLSPGSFNW